MIIMADAPMRGIRERAGITRQNIVDRSGRGVALGSVRNAEKGQAVTVSTAQQILEALNSLLQERGFDPVQMQDLGLKLY